MSINLGLWWKISDFAAKRCSKWWMDENRKINYNKYFNEILGLRKELAYLKEVHKVDLQQKDTEIERLSNIVYILNGELNKYDC